MPLELTETGQGLNRELKIPGLGNRVKLKDLAVFARAAKLDWPEHLAGPAHPITGHRHVRGSLYSPLDKPYVVRLPYGV